MYNLTFNASIGFVPEVAASGLKEKVAFMKKWCQDVSHTNDVGGKMDLFLYGRSLVS
jgi:hypothetical protein